MCKVNFPFCPRREKRGVSSGRERRKDPEKPHRDFRRPRKSFIGERYTVSKGKRRDPGSALEKVPQKGKRLGDRSLSIFYQGEGVRRTNCSWKKEGINNGGDEDIPGPFCDWEGYEESQGDQKETGNLPHENFEVASNPGGRSMHGKKRKVTDRKLPYRVRTVHCREAGEVKKCSGKEERPQPGDKPIASDREKRRGQVDSMERRRSPTKKKRDQLLFSWFCHLPGRGGDGRQEKEGQQPCCRRVLMGKNRLGTSRTKP